MCAMEESTVAHSLEQSRERASIDRAIRVDRRDDP
jgi:hypothetical protein